MSVTTHCIILVVDIEDAFLFAGEGTHAEKELGDVVAQSAQCTPLTSLQSQPPVPTQVLQVIPHLSTDKESIADKQLM